MAERNERKNGRKGYIPVTALALADKLREAAVKRHLTTFETWASGSTRAGLLTTHAETARGALARSNTATLAGLALLAAGCRLEVAEDTVLFVRQRVPVTRY